MRTLVVLRPRERTPPFPVRPPAPMCCQRSGRVVTERSSCRPTCCAELVSTFTCPLAAGDLDGRRLATLIRSTPRAISRHSLGPGSTSPLGLPPQGTWAGASFCHRPPRACVSIRYPCGINPRKPRGSSLEPPSQATPFLLHIAPATTYHTHHGIPRRRHRKSSPNITAVQHLSPSNIHLQTNTPSHPQIITTSSSTSTSTTTPPPPPPRQPPYAGTPPPPPQPHSTASLTSPPQSNPPVHTTPPSSPSASSPHRRRK